jgi:hypothetical protein
LGRLDFKKAGSGKNFDDFVFEQTDFSIYKSIPREDFVLFAGSGLEDYEDVFFEKNFNLGRKTIAGIIGGAYIKAGPSFCIRDEKLLLNPLMLSVIRTLHTSLQFASLFTPKEVLGECNRLIRLLQNRFPGAETFFYLPRNFGGVFRRITGALHKTAFTHADGMKTALSAAADGGGLILSGTFHPGGKAYTMPLVKAP